MQISREVLVAKSWARGGEVAANDEIITRSQAHTQLYSVWCAVCTVCTSVYSMQCEACRVQCVQYLHCVQCAVCGV